MRISRFSSRTGVTMFAVLACLFVVTTIILGSVVSSLRHRQQTRTELQLEQTRWLLDAGVTRAIAMSEKGEFVDEEFQIDDAFRQFSGNLKLEGSESAGQIQMRIVATLKGAGEHQLETTRSRELFFEKRSSGREKPKDDSANEDQIKDEAQPGDQPGSETSPTKSK